MNVEYGWTGKILRVNLSAREWTIEPSDSYVTKFIGGVGLGLKVLWDEVIPQASAFGEDNKIIFAPGPLTGTLVPGSGRFEVVSVSPKSYPKETITRSGMGGFWGPELKYAGYDALIIEGISENWTNLWICDDNVEFRDASDYLGADTYVTQKKLRQELDQKAKILCIGPAGEKLSRIATIISGTSFASGRSGFGAVMGAKHLKAIAVRGTKSIKIYDSERLIEACKKARYLCTKHRSRVRSTGILTPQQQTSMIDKYRKKSTGCFGCPVQCFYYLDVPGSGGSSTHCINYFYYHRATKFYGDCLERDQAASDGYVLSNRLGLDTFELGPMIEILKKLYEDGILTSTIKLPVDQIGSREFIKLLIESIAYRKGFGDVLSEGGARMADQMNGVGDLISKFYPAYGSAEHGAGNYSVHNSAGFALLWSFDSRCPVVDGHSYTRLSVSYLDDPFPNKLCLSDAKAIAKELYGSAEAIDHSTFAYKPEAVVYTQNRSMVNNVLVLCDWIFPIIISQVKNDRSGDTSLESELFSAVTGHESTMKELELVGERVWNLARALMVREGRNRDHDTINSIFFKGSGDGKLSKVDL